MLRPFSKKTSSVVSRSVLPSLPSSSGPSVSAAKRSDLGRVGGGQQQPPGAEVVGGQHAAVGAEALEAGQHLARLLVRALVVGERRADGRQRGDGGAARPSAEPTQLLDVAHRRRQRLVGRQVDDHHEALGEARGERGGRARLR